MVCLGDIALEEATSLKAEEDSAANSRSHLCNVVVVVEGLVAEVEGHTGAHCETHFVAFGVVVEDQVVTVEDDFVVDSILHSVLRKVHHKNEEHEELKCRNWGRE